MIEQNVLVEGFNLVSFIIEHTTELIALGSALVGLISMVLRKLKKANPLYILFTWLTFFSVIVMVNARNSHDLQSQFIERAAQYEMDLHTTEKRLSELELVVLDVDLDVQELEEEVEKELTWTN